MLRSILTIFFAAATVPALALGAADIVRSGKMLILNWKANGPVDVYAATSATATMKSARLVSSSDTDGHYALEDDGSIRRYFLLRDKRSGKTMRIAERVLPLTTGSNFRDLGGYPAANGKHVRWGMIYRSAATPKLDTADAARIQSLGLTSMIDLRSSEERQMAPTKLTGIRYSAIDYSLLSMLPKDLSSMKNGGALYRGMPTFLVPQLRMVFDDLLGRRGPVMYHCTAGQDRTGITTALILHTLGVPRAIILEDYHLTTQVRQPENEMVPISAALAETNPVAKMFARYKKEGQYSKPEPLRDPDGRAFLDSAFEAIEKSHGSLDAFLAKELGIGPREVSRLRAAYTE